MRRLASARAGLALLLLSPAAGANASAPVSIVGDWFGRGQPHDAIMVYLDHIKPDGTYVSEFELCKGKQSYRSIQSGTWSASPDMFRITTTIVDGRKAYFQTDYANISNDGKSWAYKIAASEPEDPGALGYEFTARRVVRDFQLPGCLQIS